MLFLEGWTIDLNTNYIFSLIKEDWIGIVNIIFHTIIISYG